MLRIISRSVVVIFQLLSVGPAFAGSSLVDLSKPQTGTSKFVVDHNFKPVKLGVPDAETEEGSRPIQGTGCKQNCAEVEGKTVQVKSYTRKDGTFVQSYMRRRPGSSR